MMNEGMQPAVPPDLSKITCPVLIIAGEHDESSGPDAARDSQRAIPGSQLKIFPTAHCSPVEQPEAYNATVLEFLSGAGLT